MINNLSNKNQIIEAYDRLHFELWCQLRISQEKDFQTLQEPEYTWITSKLLNQFTVGLNNFENASIKQVVRKALKQAKGSGFANLWWLVDSETHTNPISNHLIKCGFGTLWNKPIMAVELDSLSEPKQRPFGLDVKQVDNEEMFKQWTAIQKEVNPDMEGLFDYIFITESGHGYDHDLPMKRYLGYIDSVPVAASYGLMAHGVVGLFHVACLPSMGRRGIGTELSLYPLREARKIGYKVGVLDSTEMGYNVYSRLGFKEFGRHMIHTLTL